MHTSPHCMEMHTRMSPCQPTISQALVYGAGAEFALISHQLADTIVSCCALLLCLQSFKDHLKLPLSSLPGRAASTRSYGDSDAASSLRSGPGGKPSSLWSFLRGPGRCAQLPLSCVAMHVATLGTAPQSHVGWVVWAAHNLASQLCPGL